MIEDNSLSVTVGIPTYNRADSYLKNALKSALAQRYENFEIVVSDNCSKDHTQALVEQMDDGRIRYFRQEKNIPANDNFNFCLQQARGDYFLLLHDDDLIDPDFVAACMQAANGDPNIGVICTGTRVIDGNGDILKEKENTIGKVSADDFFLGWFNGKFPLYLCSTLYNTKALKTLGGFYSPKDLFQDVVATVQLIGRHGLLNISEVKASFRRHGENRGGIANVIEWCIDSRYLLDVMCWVAKEKKAEVRQKGLSYFCRNNYQKAAIIANPFSRWKVYYFIYMQFERCCPLSYVLRRYEIGWLKDVIKRSLFLLSHPKRILHPEG
jgi:glycosyltransferase involved in cell wall biosynthesis